MQVGEHRTNRLAGEASPYLQQHAHNPVDWYPWSDEAHERARAEDRPILLSIGYSACHWCHVMERECFDDPGIARLMNERFVAVKVDREERPDLDQVYQTVVQLMGRQGGWPLTVFLTPDLKPFFGGTYFPPVDRYGMPGFPTVLRAASEAYEERRQDVERSADELTRAIEKVTSVAGEPTDVPDDVLRRASQALSAHLDASHGGFGGAPKFPNTFNLDVLLRTWRHHGDAHALTHVRRSLDAMREGGIYDQLGGGFHRYSVDARWAVPHFEKMLYDNALLVRLYVDAWRATGEPQYAETVRQTLDYVLREMCAPDGGFYSSQDADSEGVEGKFFVWTPDQVREALGEGQDAEIACLYFGVDSGGNFEEGATVLHVSRPVATVARQLGRDEEEVRAVLGRARERLREVREQRIRPFRDEKHIAAWNGLMIGALAEAGAALGEPRYVEAARRALSFVRERMWSDGRLARIYKDGRAKGRGFLDDYANLAGAAFDVYEATMDEAAFAWGRALVDAALEDFWDEQSGGFFFGPSDASDVLVRTRDQVDASVPSGASAMCQVLLRLHGWTDEERYRDRAERTLRSLVALALDNPLGFGNLLGAADRYVHGPTSVVVVSRTDGAEGEAETDALLRVARRAYLPNRLLARLDPGASRVQVRGPAAILGEQRQQDGRATAYVCHGRVCGPPETEPSDLADSLVAVR